MGVLLRLACCAYLVFYVIVPMLRGSSAEDGMSPTLKLAIAIAFIVVTAAILVFTAVEFVRNWKAGYNNAASYTDDGADENGDGPEPGIVDPGSGDEGDEDEGEDNEEFEDSEE